MIEITEPLTIPFMSNEFQTDRLQAVIQVRYYTTDNMTLEYEPLSYRLTGDEHDTKITRNDPDSRLICCMVDAEIDERALECIRENPAFDSMTYPEPYMSQFEFQRMVL